MSRDTNWYKELKAIDEKEKIIAIAYDGKKFKSLDEIKDKIDYDFNSGYGGKEGFAFTAWTKDRVYFPGCYDGSEWIDSIPRNPCDEATSHVGGG
mgnify:CR=1 FL=1